MSLMENLQNRSWSVAEIRCLPHLKSLIVQNFFNMAIARCLIAFGLQDFESRYRIVINIEHSQQIPIRRVEIKLHVLRLYFR